MPLLLRKIRKSKWYKNESLLWLKDNEIQADALGDVGTSGNTLSVWLVKDDRSNLDQVIVALASACDNVSNLDYALIDIESLMVIGIKVEENEGQTPYLSANQWHRDLVEISTNKLFRLAETIFLHSDKDRVQQKKVLELFKDAVRNEQIDKTRLKEGITKHLH